MFGGRSTLYWRTQRLGVPVDDDLRKFVLQRFPFSLIYSLSPDVLRVEVVAHQSRRPDYWRSRVDR
jgi:hypothetical protein